VRTNHRSRGFKVLDFGGAIGGFEAPLLR
jgi:hypothetical protein